MNTLPKLLYIHGAFSAFNPESQKVQSLSKDFDVLGFNYSMETPFAQNIQSMVALCQEQGIRYVAGTSLGGLYACEICHRANLVAAIMINPCVEPHLSLKEIAGVKKNFKTGVEEELTLETIATYPERAHVSDRCVIFVGLQDDLIDAHRTIALFKDTTKVIVNPDEDHRWESFQQSDDIQEFIKEKA